MSKDSFSHWPTPKGTSLSVHFKDGESRCGIYILEFADGERYVGQTVDVVRRFADHQRRFPDIEAVQFLAVPREQLNSAERQMVQANADAGHALRNIQLVNLTWTDSSLDAEIDRPMQESWLLDGIQDHQDDALMLRAKRRKTYRAHYEEFCSLPSHAEVFNDLVTYVDTSIVWPSVTVESNWTVSVLPRTGKSKDSRRLFTVNCGLVEVFVMFEDRKTGDASWFLNFDSSVVPVRQLPREWREVAEEADSYRSIGCVGRIYGFAGSLSELFDEVPLMARASRQLALALMRKQPAMFARSHSDALADDVLCALAERSEGGASQI